MEANKLQGNIWKYALVLITNKRIFVAVLGAYYLTVPGVDAAGVGLILLAGSLGGFVLEIPSGYFSDKFGHKQTLVLSAIFLLISSFIFLIANSISLLLLASVFFSASIAFFSGTGSAFMHETLKGLGREQDYSRVMGKLSSLGFAVPIVLTALVPFLVNVSFKAPFAISLVIDVIGLFAAVALSVPPVTPEQVAEVRAKNFRQVVLEGYRYGFFSLALFSGVVSGVLFAVGGFRAPYQLLIGVPVIWFGVFFGIGRAFASLMLAYSGKLRAMSTLNSFYGFQLILYALLILILGITKNTWIIVAMFMVTNAFQWGLGSVDTSYILDTISGSKFKATLLSVAAQIENLLGAAAAFGVGWLIQATSYRNGFFYLALCFVVILLPLYLYIVRKRKVI